MPQTINTFVKSKMNKDLDDRLLSNGEYRDAQNVNVSRSEGEDVGALENVLGNTLLSDFGLSAIPNLEIIGYFSDDTNNRIFFIATDYTDTSGSELENPATFGSNCYILLKDNKLSSPSILVQGRFLNFSKTHPVYSIDLIEDLLFWTDNRNQPRKINVKKAIDFPATSNNPYYTTEDQISVAKYYPYNCPKLFKVSLFSINTPSSTGPTTGPHNVIDFSSGGASQAADLKVGMYIRDKPTVVFSGDTYPGLPQSDTVETGTGIPLQVARGPEGTGSSRTFYTNYAVDFGSSTIGNAQLASLLSPSSINTTDQYLTNSSRVTIAGYTAGATSIVVTDSETIGDVLTNMKVSFKKDPKPDVIITGVTPNTPNNGQTTITTNKALSDSAGSYVLFKLDLSWPNGNYVSTWPGDKDFLNDKFVRFAYRFKFDDGEYSLMSPFTQPAFIPNQGGYIKDNIISSTNPTSTANSQEVAIRTSTIVSFFENSVDQVDLHVETPFLVNQLSDKLKVNEIQILYKESDALAIKVLDDISTTNSSITSNATNSFVYNYQSRKPFRTLPNREATRVFDKVPIRAMSQSIVGNRVVYGNFLNKHTPPESIQYNVQASKKRLFNSYSPESKPEQGKSFVAYPTHTLKQNRTYQVGVVLSDRYGRQSDVILSSVDNFQFSQSGSGSFSGSTIFHPYKDSSPSTSTSKYFGDSLKVLFRNKIPETVSYADGYPGLHKKGEYIEKFQSSSNNKTFALEPDGNHNIDVGYIATGVDADNNSFVRSVVEVTRDSNTNLIVSGKFNKTLNKTAGDIVNFHGPYNNTGWYSYKVVVKQQQQDYYNVYLPSLVQGNISNGAVSTNPAVGFTTLISDNINKIPADLENMQPEQTQFRTSDDLFFPRIGPLPVDSTNSLARKSVQYYLGDKSISVDTIGKVTDLGIEQTNTIPIQSEGIFDAKSNPSVAKLSLNSTNIGGIPASTSSEALQLSVLETEPVESKLEIYWETSTSGLIEDLNNLIFIGVNADEDLPQDDPVPE